MKYENVIKGKFVSRPNRFIAYVEIDGEVEKCHVKNTGRCRELLVPGVTVILEPAKNPDRKTKYSLIAVYKGDTLINMDSQVPNQVAAEWITDGGLLDELTYIRREMKFGNSRFDIYAETKTSKVFVEVKGVTLENNGIASFPDAPTQRGVKHVMELCEAVKAGFEAYILFVIQMKGITKMTPNDSTHKEFGDALRYANENGVHIVAVDCVVKEDELNIDKYVKVCL